MIPVLTPEDVAAVDAAASDPVEALIDRAGGAVARSALQLLGGAYGRRVVVVAGKGNNGADGRAAARRLSRAGARVAVFSASRAPAVLPACDLVIDAAYGVGFRGEYKAPDPGGAAVLAVDVPSGVDARTGEASESAVWADATVTFAGYKPGLLFGAGLEHAGHIELAGIGLDATAASVARAWLVEDGDVAAGLPSRARDGHKWQSAVHVVAGSPGMGGSARLVSQAAMRAGAGYVRLGSPGVEAEDQPADEVVAVSLSRKGWDDTVLADADRFGCVVVGPGLGRGDHVAAAVGRLLSRCPVPVVVDADGLNALGSVDDAAALIRSRSAATVLTPHDGELSRLTGQAPGSDRLADARELARRTGAVVLLKGSTTAVAEPGGSVLVAAAGSSRLATAGTGDVLAGIIGAFVASGVDAHLAAALAAHVHGRAAASGPARGLVATDLLQLVPQWLTGVLGG